MGSVGVTWSFLSVSDPRILVMGRVDDTHPSRLRIGYPGVTLRLAFTGGAIALRGSCSNPNCSLAVLVDDEAPRRVVLPTTQGEVTLVEALSPIVHQLDLVWRNETWQGIFELEGFVLRGAADFTTPIPWPKRKLLFVGDSVTGGEAADRVAEAEIHDKPSAANAAKSYAMLLARNLNAQYHLVSFGGRGVVRDWQGRRDILNAPQFFELAIPEESRRVPWDHDSYVPDAVFISLGTNDFNLALGAFPEREDFVGAYVTFVRRLRSLYPETHILVTEGAIVNDGAAPQKTTLRDYLAEVARRLADPRLHVLPSNHYPGDSFDAHPTAEQHRAMAQDFAPAFRRILGW